MTVTIREAICIHAKAPDLAFLNQVRNSIGAAAGRNYQNIRLSEPKFERLAKEALARDGRAAVIIFAHGAGDYIRGGHYRDRLGGGTYVERFIERKDLKLFRDKVIFCMSCESKDLAVAAIAAGAIAFVGFNEVPFLRVDEEGRIISSDKFTTQAQSLIAEAVSSSLIRFFSGKCDLRQAVDYMRLRICRIAVDFVRDSKNGPNRWEIAALFLKIKDGVQYFGNPEILFDAENLKK